MDTNSSAPIARPHPTLQLLLLRATESLEFPIFIHTRKDARENEESSLITTLYHQTPISPPKTQAKYIQPQLRSLTAPLLPCNVTLLSRLSLLALSMRLFLFFTNPFLVYYFSIILLPISLELSYSCPPVSPYPKQQRKQNAKSSQITMSIELQRIKTRIMKGVARTKIQKTPNLDLQTP